MHQRIMCTSAPGFETENKKSSYSPRDIAEMLQISENLVYEKMKKGRCGNYLSGLLEEISEKAFDKWYRSQKRYRNAEDREKVRDIVESSMAMPEMAGLLGVPRSTVYGLLNQSEILKTIEFDGRRRVTKKSFYEWYASQDDYHIVSDENVRDSEG